MFSGAVILIHKIQRCNSLAAAKINSEHPFCRQCRRTLTNLPGPHALLLTKRPSISSSLLPSMNAGRLPSKLVPLKLWNSSASGSENKKDHAQHQKQEKQ